MERISSFIPNPSYHNDDRRMSRVSMDQEMLSLVEEVKIKCDKEKKTAINTMINFLKRKHQASLKSIINIYIELDH